jgi:cyclopropane fatty-acyl-phospholipid synthase-like methyltransferase
MGKKVLEIGCAKGFVVEDLRGFGVDAHGLDVSSYAIGEASDAVKPYLTIGDARTDLSRYKNKEFDVVFTLRFMECVPESDIPWLVAQMNRISQFQFHVIDEVIKPNFYTNKLLEDWIKYNWAKGTVLQSNQSRKKILTK